MQYDLIDKELKSYFISAQKYMFLFFSFVSFVFVILLLFNKSAGNILFLVPFAITAFTFLMTWTVDKKMYGKKIGINDDEIIVYDYKSRRIQEFKIGEINKALIDVSFLRGYVHIKRKCMIIYIDFEPYEDMEYRSYWNEENVLIIQNNETIEILQKTLINK